MSGRNWKENDYMTNKRKKWGKMWEIGLKEPYERGKGNTNRGIEDWTAKRIRARTKIFVLLGVFPLERKFITHFNRNM
jgi:hypothetical protein